MSDEDHKFYSRGYSKGRTAGRRDAEIEMRELKAKIRALNAKIAALEENAAMPPTVERSSDAHLLACLADRIPKAIEQGKIGAWEKAGISIIEFIASQYTAPLSSIEKKDDSSQNQEGHNSTESGSE